jgi:hypothetical protein
VWRRFHAQLWSRDALSLRGHAAASGKSKNSQVDSANLEEAPRPLELEPFASQDAHIDGAFVDPTLAETIGGASASTDAIVVDVFVGTVPTMLPMKLSSKRHVNRYGDSVLSPSLSTQIMSELQAHVEARSKKIVERLRGEVDSKEQQDDTNDDGSTISRVNNDPVSNLLLPSIDFDSNSIAAQNIPPSLDLLVQKYNGEKTEILGDDFTSALLARRELASMHTLGDSSDEEMN